MSSAEQDIVKTYAKYYTDQSKETLVDNIQFIPFQIGLGDNYYKLNLCILKK